MEKDEEKGKLEFT